MFSSSVGRNDFHSRRMLVSALLVFAALAWLHPSATAQFSDTGQFTPFDGKDYPMDDVRGEVVELETQLIRPLEFCAPEGLLAVANVTDDRVVFLDASLGFVAETVVGQGVTALVRSPYAAELWVSVRHQMAVVVIDLVTKEVTHLLRPPIQPSATGAPAAAAPGGIAFAENKAYVVGSEADALNVYDAATKSYVRTIRLKKRHHGRSTSQNFPFDTVAFAGKIWVSSHLSGNNTTARIDGGLDLEDNGVTESDLGPDQVRIVDFDTVPGRKLPDFDVAVVDPITDSVETMVKDVGTVLFGLHGHAATNEILVAAMEARNAEFVGEGAFPDGRVMFNRLGRIDVATKFAGNPISTEFLGATQEHVAMPTNLAEDPNGRVFVTGHINGSIGVFDANLGWIGSIPVPSGPRGLAVDGDRHEALLLQPRHPSGHCFRHLGNATAERPLGHSRSPGPNV